MPPKGYRFSEETRRRMSIGHKGIKEKPMSAEGRRNMARKGNQNSLGCCHSEETKRKISDALTGKLRGPRPEEVKARISKTETGKPKSIGHSLYCSLAKTGAYLSKYYKDSHSRTQKRLFQDPIHKEKQLKAMIAGQQVVPNKPETLLTRLASIACPDEYEFTGDGTITIDGLRPDLCNKNGQKKVILHHGDYWHKDEDTQIIINRYAKHGYHCLVIWEHELENYENVIAKIRKFNNQGHVCHTEEMPIVSRQLSMFD